MRPHSIQPDHKALPHLFVSFLLVSRLVVHQQAAVVRVRVCASVEGVHGLGVVAHVGLLGYCTVKGPVLLCLERHTHTKLINTRSNLSWACSASQALVPVSWRCVRPCRSAFGCSPGSPWGRTWRCPWCPLSVWAGSQPWSDRTGTGLPCPETEPAQWRPHSRVQSHPTSIVSFDINQIQQWDHRPISVSVSPTILSGWRPAPLKSPPATL